ncbi:GNAT family N-acetyltransferase [Actinoplanes oblitus]|uniref:GNAT family N-acetyltransferase n=1 Tax=Actinoplanes oblitus TaxID=3040509 RepID=A0ABY8WS40_9ACTN|nr:GNAT family N-acetyltransferase [Actinoplanes oblitus]WIN00278.1 GNAT family N-acetyltransferase [Actinoplanes oblitus]
MITHEQPGPLRIEPDDLSRPEVQQLIADHLSDMHATSPAESVHALDHAGLRAPGVSFWTVWAAAELLGCGALKQLSPSAGEIKAMRTRPQARGRGVAAHLLAFLLDECRRRGYRTVSLETGSQEFFAPARRLYARHGFVTCPPFADYSPDPNSVYLTLPLSPDGGTPGPPRIDCQ